MPALGVLNLPAERCLTNAEQSGKMLSVPLTPHMTTALICSHDHLIRALYDAKAALKDASSAYVTADHNYKACCSDRDARSYDLIALAKVRDDAHDDLCRVEKTYDGIHALCTKLDII